MTQNIYKKQLEKYMEIYLFTILQQTCYLFLVL